MKNNIFYKSDGKINEIDRDKEKNRKREKYKKNQNQSGINPTVNIIIWRVGAKSLNNLLYGITFYG